MQLTEDAKANKNMENLTKFGTAFMPAALVASIFGMNTFGSFDYSILIEVLIIALAGLAVVIGLKNTKKGGK
jgi:Mg2+ and Co2+ transporter CorA